MTVSGGRALAVLRNVRALTNASGPRGFGAVTAASNLAAAIDRMRPLALAVQLLDRIEQRVSDRSVARIAEQEGARALAPRAPAPAHLDERRSLPIAPIGGIDSR